MSLRQRAAQAVEASRTTSEASGPSTAPIETSAAAAHHQDGPKNRRTGNAAPRKGTRLNRVLGRIVPVILLVYISYAYDLVVVRYAYRYLHLEQKRTLLPIFWLLPAHGLFLGSLRAYLRVFFAHSPSTLAKSQKSGLPARLRTRLGATFPHPEQAQLHEQRALKAALSTLGIDRSDQELQIELCQPDGSPVRCFRDSCGGRIKPFRTRHCGDCGTCRVGFDHHCAWFDNDVTAPATLRSFIGLLLSVPPLYLLGLGPLFPVAWQTLRRINIFAAHDSVLQTSWWGRWYSWIGGPAFRWMVGFAFGASRWSKATVDRLPHESPRAPLLVAVGAVFVFVASALATSSLTHLRHGMLTVDVERSKAFRKLQRRLEKLQQDPTGQNGAKIQAIQGRMDALSPVQYFRVVTVDKASGERTSERVVPLSPEQGLLSHGSAWADLCRFLGKEHASTPAWTVPPSVVQKVVSQVSTASSTQ